MVEQGKEPGCPGCGDPGPHETAVRSGKVGGVTLADVGWRCRKCGHEWGFEHFHEERR